jgi:hypothetical protein
MSDRRPKGLRDLADELAEQIDALLARSGRGEKPALAHVTPGELFIPQYLLTPELVAVIRAEAEKQGVDPARLLVGSSRNSVNPRTGQREFFDPAQDPMEEITVTTPRETGLVQLPQDVPNDYRIYGTPLHGQAQYGVPAAMEVIGAASHAWKETGHAPFNVGNMSKSDLSPYDRRSEKSDHSKGTGVDIRPMRTDGRNLGISFREPGYDRAATQKLVDELRATGGVELIYFNDPEISGVTYQDRHDDHLHVRVNPNYRRPSGK